MSVPSRTVGATLNAAGAITINAVAQPVLSITSHSKGVSVVAIGVSVAQASNSPTVQAYLGESDGSTNYGSGTVTAGGTLTVEANVSGLGNTVEADALAASLLLSVSGDEADADTSPIVEAYVNEGPSSNPQISAGNVSIVANSTGSSSANSKGSTSSLFAAVNVNIANAAVGQATFNGIGGASMLATTPAETAAFTDAGVNIDASGTISIAAYSSQNVASTATASAGAAVAGASTTATTVRNDPVSTNVGSGTTLNAGGDVSITASSGSASENVSSFATNDEGGLVTIGVPQAYTTISDGATAEVAQGVTVNAAGNFYLLANAENGQSSSMEPVNSQAITYAIGGINVTRALAITTVNDYATAVVDDASSLAHATQVTAALNIDIASHEGLYDEAYADADDNGLGSSDYSQADTQGTHQSTTQVGSDAQLIAGLQVQVLADHSFGDLVDAESTAHGEDVGAHLNASTNTNNAYPENIFLGHQYRLRREPRRA